VGVLQSQGGAGTTADALSVEAVHPPGAPSGAGGYSTTSYGSSYVVGARSFDALRLDLPAADIARAEETLARGGVVIFGHDSPAVATATLTRQQYRVDGGEATTVGTWPVPATVVAVPGVGQPVSAVLSEQALRTTGMTARTTALLVDGVTIGTSAQDRLNEAVTGIDAEWSVHVERGFHDNSTAVTLLLLATVGGALVLGGTLTSTFLALSDARPDFATMGAVGAAPRTRRIVAAAYAGTIGLVGAVVGALVGFVPGIAVTFPLTGAAWAPEGSTDTNGVPLPEHFLDVPWLLIGGLVVVLPLVTAAVVGLTSRSRLPMVSRLS
jgi:putative ABC transport system permease protein